MKIRVKFTKGESVKYLGHLDIMRAFQKCLNRAQINMIYSEGFNPHQKISFALPLGVGIMSDAEYMDAEIKDGQNTLDIMNALNAVSGEGFDIISVKILKDDAIKAMAAVEYADFSVYGYSNDITNEKIFDFLSQKQIIAEKKTKTGAKEIDIRPMIYDIRSNDDNLFLRLKAGSIDNLKVDTALSALYSFCSLSFDNNNVNIVRKELLGEGFVPLDMLDTIKE